MSNQEATTTIFITGCLLAFAIVLLVNIRGCNEAHTKAMIESGHTISGDNRWNAPIRIIRPEPTPTQPEVRQ